MNNFEFENWIKNIQIPGVADAEACARIARLIQ